MPRLSTRSLLLNWRAPPYVTRIKVVIVRSDRETHVEAIDAAWHHAQPVGGRGDDLSFDLRSLHPSAGLHIEGEKALGDSLRRVERRVQRH